MWALCTLAQLFAVLAHLRHHRIWHRDVKPDNLLLRYPLHGTELLVTDWGWTTRAGPDPAAAHTPGCCAKIYRAPEAFLTGRREGRTETWHFGCRIVAPPFRDGGDKQWSWLDF